MIFTTFSFFVFFIVLFLAYYILPKKFQWIVLLIGNIYFYLCACPNVLYISYILIASIITFLIAKKINKLEYEKNSYFYNNKIEENDNDQFAVSINNKKKVWLFVGIVLTLSMLVVIKYTDFLIGTTISFINLFGFGFKFESFKFVMPLGISFYTFMTIGYMVDIYRNEYEPEKNIFKYFTFVSYFPHVLQGPIDSYNEVAKKMYLPKEFDYTKTVDSIYRIVIGVFKKIVIADQIAIVISIVTNNVNDYYGISIIGAMILYAIQLYADFSGYMDIAIGCSNILGIDIAENFNAPYFSKNIAEFWRRWHISLNQWFVNYIYIPLGGNRKGKLKKLRNIFIIFFVSGLWHGAFLSYVVWGIYHGLVMVIANLINPLFKKIIVPCKNKLQENILNIVRILRTFVIVTFGYFFLSVEDIGISFNMIKNMFIFNKRISTIRMITTKEAKISIFIGIIFLFILDYCKEKNIDIFKKLKAMPTILRWIIYCIGIYLIAVFCASDAQEFLYFKF